MRTLAETSKNLQCIRIRARTGTEWSIFSALLKLKYASCHNSDVGSCLWRVGVFSEESWVEHKVNLNKDFNVEKKNKHKENKCLLSH